MWTLDIAVEYDHPPRYVDGAGFDKGGFAVGWKGGFRVFLRCLEVHERHPGGKPCFLTLTFRPETPEKQGVLAHPKKHEKIFKKPLASKTPF